MSNTTKETYETGATSHAVNDLILFADNTRELAQLRDEIYASFLSPKSVLDTIPLIDRFQNFYLKSVSRYKKEFTETDRRYFLPLGSNMCIEFCTLYANDLDNWISEHKQSSNLQ